MAAANDDFDELAPLIGGARRDQQPLQRVRLNLKGVGQLALGVLASVAVAEESQLALRSQPPGSLCGSRMTVMDERERRFGVDGSR